VRGWGLDSSGSGYFPVAGSCEYGNEPLGTIECGKCLDKLSNYYLFRNYVLICNTTTSVIILVFAYKIVFRKELQQAEMRRDVTSVARFF
jgi:hypothetical protein